MHKTGSPQKKKKNEIFGGFNSIKNYFLRLAFSDQTSIQSFPAKKEFHMCPARGLPKISIRAWHKPPPSLASFSSRCREDSLCFLSFQTGLHSLHSSPSATESGTHKLSEQNADAGACFTAGKWNLFKLRNQSGIHTVMHGIISLNTSLSYCFPFKDSVLKFPLGLPSNPATQRLQPEVSTKHNSKCARAPVVIPLQVGVKGHQVKCWAELSLTSCRDLQEHLKCRMCPVQT